MTFRLNHCNINVTNMDQSISFYEKALGLKVNRRRVHADGAFEITYLEDGAGGFQLELTCLRDHPQRYDLGENESHICFVTPDFEAAHEHHREMGCICYENTAMGLYFIEDPDGYWLEILPEKR